MEKSSHFLFSFYLVENTKSFYISMIFSVFQFDAIRVPKHKIHAHFERETNVTNVEFHFNRKTPSSATRESSNKWKASSLSEKQVNAPYATATLLYYYTTVTKTFQVDVRITWRETRCCFNLVQDCRYCTMPKSTMYEHSK